jgi:hypothetical protein
MKNDFSLVSSDELTAIFQEEAERVASGVDLASTPESERKKLFEQAKQATGKRVAALNAKRHAEARAAAWVKFDEAEAARLAAFERLDAATVAHADAHAAAVQAANAAKAAFPSDPEFLPSEGYDKLPQNVVFAELAKSQAELLRKLRSAAQ